MQNSPNLRARLSLTTVILDYLHSRDLKDHEGFAALLVNRLLKASPSDEDALLAVLQGTNHSFFRFNSTTKADFIRGFPTKRVRWIIDSTSGITEEFVVRTFRNAPLVRTRVRRVYLDDLDSFTLVRAVKKTEVTNRVPLDVPERVVKKLLCEVLGVFPIPKDWGGERSDLMADVSYKGRIIPAAFMLKGNGTPGRLTVSKCGKNGDQIVRLIEEPARLFVVQHVDAIDSNVAKLLGIAVGSVVRTEQLYYCLVDGIETARLFEAYGLPGNS